jgi:hypothetical protein
MKEYICHVCGRTIYDEEKQDFCDVCRPMAKILVRFLNGLWAEYHLGEIYMAWNENPETMSLAFDKATDALPISIRFAYRVAYQMITNFKGENKCMK